MDGRPSPRPSPAAALSRPLPALLLSTALAALLVALAAPAGTSAPETPRQDPIALSYYNLIIIEYSYKFWAAFMVATLVILLYSCLAAVWVAQNVYLAPPISYDEYDYLAKRSASEEDEIDPSPGWWPPDPPTPRTSKRIFRAISEPPLPT